MNFINHMERNIKEQKEKFNHDRKIIVHDTKWEKLTSLLSKLQGYKETLIFFTYGTHKNTDIKALYDDISILYKEVSQEREKMLPSIIQLEKDIQRRQETKRKYNIV